MSGFNILFTSQPLMKIDGGEHELAFAYFAALPSTGTTELACEPLGPLSTS
ncbi:hypothetical protein EDB51_11123 [Vibrio crassostreae]|nr:hypothetical protein EDB51_11123 [Vibrio crassostreae]CAK2581837.1 conserved hypothetical protein [Vibrio crassostreae]CAK2640146.1 conserved hypothetical protein [Vibrio crassostreae]CAK3056456.1 conserved hypothetical protein [Vibrio crassostreae]CAK3598107.1 conserved hypothetical protein [Vibrio crassostreae]